MSQQLERICPPYQGDEPYLCLCFCASDAKRVRPLLLALAERGVRVWWSCGKTEDRRLLQLRQNRENGASLLVIFLTDAARNDRSLKATALFQQQRGTPLVVIDADEGDAGLSMGLNADMPHVKAWALTDLGAAGEELMRCEGFSYDLIGEPQLPSVDSDGAFGRMRTLVLLALATALLAAGLAGARLGWFVDDGLHEDDTLALSSPALILATRAALDGGAITPETVTTIKVLRLNELPEDLSELDAYTGLERLEIPQSQATEAVPLIADASFDIVLVGR